MGEKWVKNQGEKLGEKIIFYYNTLGIYIFDPKPPGEKWVKNG